MGCHGLCYPFLHGVALRSMPTLSATFTIDMKPIDFPDVPEQEPLRGYNIDGAGA